LPVVVVVIVVGVVCRGIRYIHVINKDDNPAARRGYTLALGALPAALVVPRAKEAVAALAGAMVIEVSE